MRLTLEGAANQIYDGPLVTVVVDDGSYLKDIAQYEKLVLAPPKAVARRRFLWRKPKPAVDYAAKLRELRGKRRALLALCQRYARWYPDRIVFIASEKNQGKRFAHKHAHTWARENFDGFVRRHYPKWVSLRTREGNLTPQTRITVFGYLTVDSDTLADPYACLHLTRALVEQGCGAATGYVDIGNNTENWLTRMVDWRYWSAFHVERAAQSQFRSVMCCSGPLSMYRGSVLDDERLGLMDLYTHQTFLGVLCTFGDDRRMTNLFLKHGLSVLFVPEATCLTYAPTTVSGYKKQQTRWNMSFYREMLWSLRELFVRNVYTSYDMIMQFILPFLLIGSLGITVYLVAFGHQWIMAVWYVATVIGIGLLRSVYGAVVRREPAYLLFSLYGFVYLWLLTVRFRAIYKLFFQRDTGWQTRAAV